VTKLTQPSGTLHSYVYDVLGLQTSEHVTNLGTCVDPSVQRIDTAYDTGDRPYLFTSYADTAGTSVVNQVEDSYNGLGQLTGEYHEHSGAVNTTYSPQYLYRYNEMADGHNNSRPTSMVYQNGRQIDDVYNTGVDATISRLSALKDDSGGTTLEAYTYLGLDTVVQRDHPEAGVMLTYLQQIGQGNVNSDGGDKYTGLDRFGRVIDQNWIKDGTTTVTERFEYGYDRNGDVLYQNNLGPGPNAAAQSELYRPNSTQSGDTNGSAYDSLGRMTAFARGPLSASGNNGSQLDQVQSSSRSQWWSLDALGNWSTVTTNGTPATQSFNVLNQSNLDTYDANGNTTVDSNGLTYVYDAWDQLKQVKSGSNVLVTYAYDALGRRIEVFTPTVQNHLYYDQSGQLTEEWDASSSLAKQYVWSAAGVDLVVLRDSLDINGHVQSGSRLYAEEDANGDVTSLVDNTQTGTAQERYEYDPYGVVTYFDASWNARSSSSFGWQMLHQGLRLDTLTAGTQTTQLYYDRARDLIANEGRFAERDPLGLGGGDSNIYRYEFNEPEQLADPGDSIVSGDPGGAPVWP
jgi:RHS repeat-associated protein